MTVTAKPMRLDYAATPNLLDSRFPYRNAVSTEIRDTWKKFGWKEPSRAKQNRARKTLNTFG